MVRGLLLTTKIKEPLKITCAVGIPVKSQGSITAGSQIGMKVNKYGKVRIPVFQYSSDNTLQRLRISCN